MTDVHRFRVAAWLALCVTACSSTHTPDAGGTDGAASDGVSTRGAGSTGESDDAGDSTGDAGTSTGSDGSSDTDTSGATGDTTGGPTTGGQPACSNGADRCVVQLAAGIGHTCALVSDGAVRCWGSGTFGKLGYGALDDIGDDETPADAGDVRFGGHAVQITAGRGHTCVLLDTGKVRCWGFGRHGKLGYRAEHNIGDDEHPETAGDVDVGGTVVQVSAGGEHTCAVLDDGSVRCWGQGQYGQLGYAAVDDIGDDEPPSAAGPVDVGGNVIQVEAGNWHTCALLDTGAVRCWGNDDGGQLGYGYSTGNIGDNETPASEGDVDMGGTVISLASLNAHSCAVLDGGFLRCWGAGAWGKLGYGGEQNVGDDETPAEMGDVDLGGSVTGVAAGDHTCAILVGGAVRCWGPGSHGQLGYGNQNDVDVPASVGEVSVGGPVVGIVAGAQHTCALLDNADVRCWGAKGYGKLGYGNDERVGDDEFPSDVGPVPIL